MINSVSDFSFQTVTATNTTEFASEVTKIWTEYNPAEAERRLSELIMIGKEATGKIVGISVWRGADILYMGNTPKGDPMRIAYFKGIRI